MLIEDKLRQNAEQQPHKTALICGDEAYTYGQLWQDVTAKVDADGGCEGTIGAPHCYVNSRLSHYIFCCSRGWSSGCSVA